MSVSSYAVTYTVKNEALLLRRNIAIHAALGCSKFYVFVEEGDCETESSVADLANVEIRRTAKPSEINDRPGWIRKIEHLHNANMDVRKRINTFLAARLAASDGIEWLASIDPDEILVTQLDDSIEPGITPLLASLSPEYDQVLVPNVEVLAISAETQDPFISNVYFHPRLPTTEFISRSLGYVVGRLLGHRPRAYAEYLVTRVLTRGALRRGFRSPLDGRFVPCGYFLGYSNCKALIRTTRASNFAFNTHKWQRAQLRPRSVKAGCLLHYDLFDWRYTRAKFNKRSSAMMVEAFIFRHALASAAYRMDSDGFSHFFEKTFCEPSEARIQFLVGRGLLRRFASVSRIAEDVRSV